MDDIIYQELTALEIIRINALESLKRELTISEKNELQELYLRRWLYDKMYGKRRRAYRESKVIKINVA